MLWLHALDVRGPDGEAASLDAIELEPLAGDGEGRLVVLAAITAFTGRSSPLRWRPRRTVRLSGDAGPGRRRGHGPHRTPSSGVVHGRGAPRARLGRPRGFLGSVARRAAPTRGSTSSIELTAAADATLHVAGRSIPVRALDTDGGLCRGADHGFVALPPADRRVDVVVTSWDGAPTAGPRPDRGA